MKQNNRMPKFRENLNKLMGELSVTEFAQKIGLSRQTVGFYLNGDRIPDCETLVQICSKCDVSANWLLGLSNVKNPDSSIAAITRSTGLSEQSVERLIESNEIRQQVKTSQGVEKILESEAQLERAHIEAVLASIKDDIPSEIQTLLDELGISNWKESKELIISTAVEKRLEISAKAAAYQETIMLDALNYMIENESQHNVLRMIALYLLSSPRLDRYLRLHYLDGGLDAQFLHMDDDLFTNAVLLEVEDQLRELRKKTSKKFDLMAL